MHESGTSHQGQYECPALLTRRKLSALPIRVLPGKLGALRTGQLLAGFLQEPAHHLQGKHNRAESEPTEGSAFTRVCNPPGKRLATGLCGDQKHHRSKMSWTNSQRARAQYARCSCKTGKSHTAGWEGLPPSSRRQRRAALCPVSFLSSPVRHSSQPHQTGSNWEMLA